MTKLLALVSLVVSLGACDPLGPLGVPAEQDASSDVVPAASAELKKVASVTGLCSSYPIPVPEGVVVVYVDEVAISRDSWTMAEHGHSITISCLDASDRGHHLISVSF